MKPGDRLIQFRFTSGLFFLLSGSLALQGASSGYLPKVGPSPLRFRPPPIVSMVVIQPLATVPESTTSSSEPAPVQGPRLPSELETPHSTAPPDVPNPNGESLLPPVAPHPQSPQPAPAANDLLIISPQMLIEYFKPQAGSTNAPVSALVPVQFMPATPAAAPGSRAIYKTE